MALYFWTLTGFAEVVKRHGGAALERQALVALHSEFEQLLFRFEAVGVGA